MKKIGVTGAAGFVGSHLCERLLAEDYEVVGVDDMSYGSMANMEPFLHHRGFKFEVLDCTQRRPLRAAFDGCDAIMHLAAKKIPRYGGTLATLEVNVTGVNAACSVALALDADVIVTSTSDVYGDGTPPYREDGQLVIGPPTSKRWAYAVSKMYDEHHALALADERDLKVTILRLFNVYGPRNHLTWWGGPTVTFIESLLSGEAVEIHGDGHADAELHVRRGHGRGLHARPGDARVPRRGRSTSARRTRSRSGAWRRRSRTSSRSRSRFAQPSSATTRCPATTRTFATASRTRRRLQALLGFEAKISLDDGLERTIDWHREQRLLDARVSAGA